MIETASFWDTYWWIFPVVMMAFCFFSMRGMGMCGMGHRQDMDSSESTKEILDRRYASGEITRSEYEEIKGAIALVHHSSKSDGG